MGYSGKHGGVCVDSYGGCSTYRDDVRSDHGSKIQAVIRLSGLQFSSDKTMTNPFCTSVGSSMSTHVIGLTSSLTWTLNLLTTSELSPVPITLSRIQAMPIMDLKTTTTRLRRTFHYPTDDTTSPDDSPSVLDEEEQESLITTLSTQNALRNAQFRLILFLLPTLSAIPYLLNLFTQSSPLPSLLALTSLASTTYLLYTLPPPETGIPFLDDARNPGQRTSQALHSDSDSDGEIRGSVQIPQLQRRRSRASSFSYVPGATRSPLETWLPYLNLGLCGVLVVIGILTSARNGEGRKGGSVLADLLPAVVYAVVLAAKMVMAGVDPERELGGLRYRYKGA